MKVHEAHRRVPKAIIPIASKVAVDVVHAVIVVVGSLRQEHCCDSLHTSAKMLWYVYCARCDKNCGR
jgi:hypothetical protein